MSIEDRVALRHLDITTNLTEVKVIELIKKYIKEGYSLSLASTKACGGYKNKLHFAVQSTQEYLDFLNEHAQTLKVKRTYYRDSKGRIKALRTSEDSKSNKKYQYR